MCYAKPPCFKVLLKWINLECIVNSIHMLDFHRIPLLSGKPNHFSGKAWLFGGTVQSLELYHERLAFCTLAGPLVSCLHMAPVNIHRIYRYRVLWSPSPTWNSETVNGLERCLLEIELSGSLSLALEPLLFYTLKLCTVSTGPFCSPFQKLHNVVSRPQEEFFLCTFKF